MSDITLDSLIPNNNCLEDKPGCAVEMYFHLIGDTGDPPHIFLLKTNDHFEKDEKLNIGLESSLGLLPRGFSPEHIHGKLMASISFYKLAQNSIINFSKKNNISPNVLNHITGRICRYVLVGFLEEKDFRKTSEYNNLIKDLLKSSTIVHTFVKTVFSSQLDSDVSAKTQPEMRPRLHLIVDLLTLQDHLNDIVKDLPETSNLRRTFQRWVIDCLQYLYSGIGDFNKIQQDFQKIAEQARDQKDLSTNLRDMSSKTFAVFNNFFNDFKGHPLRNFSDNGFNHLSDIEVKLLTQWQDHFSQRLLQVKETVFRESIHYYLVVVDGQLNTPEVKQHLKEAHISPNWLENQTNFRNISDAILSALKIIPTAEQKEIEISLDLKTLNQKIKQLVKEHFVQEREYKIGVLAVLNFLFQTDKDKDGNKKIINENWANQEGFKIRMSQFTSAENDNLLALKNSMQRGISSSLTQTNKYLPWVEGALCVAGLVVGGVGSGFKERASIVTGSTVTGVGCGAFLTHFIYPSRNPYIADSIGGAILGTAAFLSSFLLTGAYLKPNMMPPPPNMMMPPPLDPNSRNPVSGWGP